MFNQKVKNAPSDLKKTKNYMLTHGTHSSELIRCLHKKSKAEKYHKSSHHKSRRTLSPRHRPRFEHPKNIIYSWTHNIVFSAYSTLHNTVIYLRYVNISQFLSQMASHLSGQNESAAAIWYHALLHLRDVCTGLQGYYI